MGSEDERRRFLIQALQTETSDLACQNCLDHLDAYVVAQLAGEDYLAFYSNVALHLDLCSECADAYARVYELELAELEGSLPRPEQIPAPDLSFLQAAKKRSRPERGTQAPILSFWDGMKDALASLDPSNWGARPTWQPALALAVVILLVGTTAYLLLFEGGGTNYVIAQVTAELTSAGQGGLVATASGQSTATAPALAATTSGQSTTTAPALAPTAPVVTPTGGISFPALFPSPIPMQSECEIKVHPKFGTITQETSTRLGCPSEPAGEDVLVQQGFQNGVMIWRQETGTITVLFDDGIWEEHEDTWLAGDPEYSCGDPLTPPTPRRSFGKLWCAGDALRSRLGVAIALETNAVTLVQPFVGGLLLTFDGQPLALFGGGNWE